MRLETGDTFELEAEVVKVKDVNIIATPGTRLTVSCTDWDGSQVELLDTTLTETVWYTQVVIFRANGVLGALFRE